MTLFGTQADLRASGLSRYFLQARILRALSCSKVVRNLGFDTAASEWWIDDAFHAPADMNVKSFQAADRAIAAGCGALAWLGAASLLLVNVPGVFQQGISTRTVGAVFLCVFLIPIGWSVHWLVRALLARRHEYKYRPRFVGSGLFRWLD